MSSSNVGMEVRLGCPFRSTITVQDFKTVQPPLLSSMTSMKDAPALLAFTKNNVLVP